LGMEFRQGIVFKPGGNRKFDKRKLSKTKELERDLSQDVNIQEK